MNYRLKSHSNYKRYLSEHAMDTLVVKPLNLSDQNLCIFPVFIYVKHLALKIMRSF